MRRFLVLSSQLQDVYPKGTAWHDSVLHCTAGTVYSNACLPACEAGLRGSAFLVGSLIYRGHFGEGALRQLFAPYTGITALTERLQSASGQFV